MAVTLREIALATGLSVPTVGNVLGTAGHRHSKVTRERVLQAAKRLGYTPNASARAMRSGRFGCIALILSRSKTRTHSFLPIGMLDGIEDELGLHDMHLSVARLADRELNDVNFVPKVLRQSTADGLIVHYTHDLPDTIDELIRKHHAPVVTTNTKLDANAVYPDDYGASLSTTRELIKRGHRRITFFNLMPRVSDDDTRERRLVSEHYSLVDRRAGYEKAMLEAGLKPKLEPESVVTPYTDFPIVARAALAGEDRPTAVLCYSERDLAPIIHAAAMIGLKIPKDLSVTFFGPDDQWVLGVELSAIPLPVAEMGREAVRMVLALLESPGDSLPSRALAYRMPAKPLGVRTIR